jgi:formate hydrogenlyase subunit 6/NADH:ubiquinone oxidoreductase subunit I
MMLSRLLHVIYGRMRYLAQGPSATVEYPYVVRHAPQGARISLRNNFAECIGCYKCEQICPVQCIEIKSEEFPNREKAPRTSRGVVFEKRVTSFKIDFNQCVSCGICVENCPTGSLTNEKNFVTPRQHEKHLAIDLVYQPRSLRKEQGYED